ncbi:hypothetical protein H0G86_000556 [Trichoderma simmonsii]|uniref:Uncharacterized protein n=1 Tax=Trichoderma simmonsii TaxID=1491479 RepID=A0A8G0L4J5_9HYPO|nr:hypothetical protein H0G86_000556 [Trichoderma simmonsii]
MPRDSSDASTWERVGSEAAVGPASEPGAASDNSSSISQGEHVRFRTAESTRAQHFSFGRGVRPQRGPWSVRYVWSVFRAAPGSFLEQHTHSCLTSCRPTQQGTILDKYRLSTAHELGSTASIARDSVL